MERTRTVDFSDDKIRFRKIGGGSLRLFGRIIKPGEVFTASPSQIPPAFRDLIIPLDEIRPVNPVPEKIVEVPQYKLQLRGKSKTLWDVVGANGKVLNEKGLTKVVAEQLIQDLTR